MARLMAFDYGLKRVGIAVSDPLQIIATGLTTVPTGDLMAFVTNYLKEEEVCTFVVGYPLNLDGSDTHITAEVRGFLRKLKKVFPSIEVETIDERFSSKQAKEAILKAGARKKQRRDKALIDKVSANILLQEYMQSKGI